MGWLAKLTGRPGTHDDTQRIPEPASRYRGVQVIAGTNGCCQAAQAIAGSRYLADEVPQLPLDDCDLADCRCTYKLFSDRRTDSRRTSDVGYDITSELRTAENRRSESGDRRKNGR